MRGKVASFMSIVLKVLILRSVYLSLQAKALERNVLQYEQCSNNRSGLVGITLLYSILLPTLATVLPALLLIVIARRGVESLLYKYLRAEVKDLTTRSGISMV